MMLSSSAPPELHPRLGGDMNLHPLNFRQTFSQSFLPQHGMPGNTYNPLCTQPRLSFPTYQYNSTVFDDSKCTTNSFQPINGRLDFNSFSMQGNPNINPYVNHRQHDATNDFSI
jgi:hypothetical protein